MYNALTQPSYSIFFYMRGFDSIESEVDRREAENMIFRGLSTFSQLSGANGFTRFDGKFETIAYFYLGAATLAVDLL